MNQRAYDQRQQAARDEGTRAQYLGMMGDFAGAAGGAVPDLLTQQQADRFQQMADQANDMLEQMQQLDQANADLFTDEQMENSRETAQNLEKMAQDAQRAADAFQNMKLEDFLGQGSGGVLGQMSDQLLDRMAAAGMSEEDQSKFQETFDLASGRETTASQVFENEVLPLLQEIAEKQGPEAAAEAMKTVLQTMQSGALAGINPEQMAAALRSSTGYAMAPSGALIPIPQGSAMNMGGGPMPVTPAAPAATTVGAAPAQVPAPPEELQVAVDTMAIKTSTMAGDFLSMSTNAAALNENLGPVQEVFNNLATPAGQIRTAIEAAVQGILNLTSQEHILKFRMQVWDPLGVLNLINNGALQMAGVVQNNGGAVPGASPSAGGPNV